MTIAETHPHLIEEWDDDRDIRTVTYGSEYKAMWKCSKGHQWKLQVNRRVKQDCPYCSKRWVIPGETDVGTLYSYLAEEWNDKEDISRFSHASHYIAHWKCKKGHQWKAAISNRTNKTFKTNCPYCSNRKILKGDNDLSTTHPELASEWGEKNKKNPFEVSSGSGYKAQWECTNGHTWKAVVGDRANSGNGCPFCSGREAIIGETDLTSTHPQFISEWDDNRDIFTVSSGSNLIVQWRCHKGHTWKTAVYNRTAGKGCPECALRNFVSNAEKEMFAYIESILSPYSMQAIQSDRKSIAPYEIDAYVPLLNVGFEFNGMYWHSDRFLLKHRGVKAKEFHTMKRDLSGEKGIDLYFIWEDDWHFHQDEVKSGIIKTLFHNNKYVEILNKLEMEDNEKEVTKNV